MWQEVEDGGGERGVLGKQQKRNGKKQNQRLMWTHSSDGTDQNRHTQTEPKQKPRLTLSLRREEPSEQLLACKLTR